MGCEWLCTLGEEDRDRDGLDNEEDGVEEEEEDDSRIGDVSDEETAFTIALNK